mmetsp:Transcript_35918/g.49848  ORF Transcript_35918/g.49848 Transcript_35918/m.49848 type:complete len:231 (+) Transcript_35918:500-1192(+)
MPSTRGSSNSVSLVTTFNPRGWDDCKRSTSTVLAALCSLLIPYGKTSPSYKIPSTALESPTLATTRGARYFSSTPSSCFCSGPAGQFGGNLCRAGAMAAATRQAPLEYSGREEAEEERSEASTLPSASTSACPLGVPQANPLENSCGSCLDILSAVSLPPCPSSTTNSPSSASSPPLPGPAHEHTTRMSSLGELEASEYWETALTRARLSGSSLQTGSRSGMREGASQLC